MLLSAYEGHKYFGIEWDKEIIENENPNLKLEWQDAIFFYINR